MADDDEARRIAAVYDEFGRRWAHGTSPLYEEWAVAVSRSPDVLDRLAALPRRMQQPNLLFAAARWHGAEAVGGSDFTNWLTDHWHDVVETGAERTVQTNEPNRCATLLPVLSRIDGPLALLEAGTAAGLCLYPDRYAVEYATPSGTHRVAPDADTDVVLGCRLDDDASLPARMPEVVWRRGIDLNPLDAADPGVIDWLANLVWPGPDHDVRVARLRAAAAVAAADPPEIVAGDILEHLTALAASAPSDATLVVFHSAVLLYLDAAERRRFADLVAALPAAVGRRVMWLSNETRGTLPEIDARVPLGVATDQRFVQTVDGLPVALAGQHGAVYETQPFAGL